MIALFDIGGTSIKYGVAGESREGFALLESGETASNARKLKGPGIEEKVVRLAEILGKKTSPYRDFHLHRRNGR